MVELIRRCRPRSFLVAAPADRGNRLHMQGMSFAVTGALFVSETRIRVHSGGEERTMVMAEVEQKPPKSATKKASAGAGTPRSLRLFMSSQKADF